MIINYTDCVEAYEAEVQVAISGQSTREFIGIAKNHQELTHAEINTLFDWVAEERVMLESLKATKTYPDDQMRETIIRGDTARKYLVLSYLSLVIEKGYEKLSWSRLQLDDLIQIGSIALLRAINNFATGERIDFEGFAATYIHNALKREIQFAKLNRRVGGSVLDDVQRFKKARAQFEERYNRLPSNKELAKVLKISKSRAFELAQLSEPEIFYEGIGIVDTSENLLIDYSSVDSVSLDELEELSWEKKEILIERGLALLPPSYANALRHHYGLEGHYPKDINEISTMFNQTYAGTQSLVNKGKGKLRMIIPQLLDGTFDYVAWRRENPKASKNALTFLAQIGVAIPLDRRLVDLRALAREHLTDVAPRDREVIMDMYGLRETAIVICGTAIAEKYNVSDGMIRKIERQVLARLALTNGLETEE